jgi:hypothetical protein
MQQPPVIRRQPLPLWLMSLAIIALTAVFTWLAPPDARPGVILSGVLVLAVYLGVMLYVRRRRREDDADQ